MPVQKIDALLGGRELQALSRKARRLMELQQVFLDAAPPALSRASRVKGCKTGILFLSAENAAVATKLRQLAPTLLLNIRKTEPEITGIQIAVQVKDVTAPRQKTPQKSALSAENVGVFRKLSDALPQSELKSALARLVRRHTRR